MSSGDSSRGSEGESSLDLLFRDLREHNHGLTPYTALKADLKHLSAADKAELWRRVREWYHQHVHRRTAKIVLRPEKKVFKVGTRTERCWSIWIREDLRAGLKWEAPTLYVLRVGPHAGARKVYARSK